MLISDPSLCVAPGQATLRVARVCGQSAVICAAASSPMKLAPITIARRAPFADAMIARQSASERNTWTWGWSTPDIGRRTGSAGAEDAGVEGRELLGEA